MMIEKSIWKIMKEKSLQWPRNNIEVSWNFGNNTATNLIIFGVNNSSWSHSGNCKNNIFVLGKGLAFRINGNFGSPEKHVSINFGKSNTKFCLSLHYNADNNYLFGNRE